MSTIPNADKMRMFIEVKKGMATHRLRLIEGLSLLEEIRYSDRCDDDIPFSCEDYFPDAEHYLEKGMWVLEEMLEYLDLHGTAITRDHIAEVRKNYIFDEDMEGANDDGE